MPICVGDSVTTNRPCYTWGMKFNVDWEHWNVTLQPWWDVMKMALDLQTSLSKTFSLLWLRKTGAADCSQSKEGLQNPCPHHLNQRVSETHHSQMCAPVNSYISVSVHLWQFTALIWGSNKTWRTRLQVLSVLCKEVYKFKALFKQKVHLLSPHLPKAQRMLQKREWKDHKIQKSG